MDLIMLGGTVLTLDARDSRAEAIAVDDGRIVATGTSAEVAALANEGTKTVRLEGRTVVPGFIDPHNHFSLTAFEPVAVDCSMPPLDGKRGALDAIAAAAAGAEAGRWIWGIGYSSRRGREPAELMRRELDAAAPENPVCVIDSSVHACYANSAALAIAGIAAATPDPHGGRILREADGSPAGMLWERAMNPVHQRSMAGLIEYYGEQAVADLVEQNALRHLAAGITSVGDANVMPEGAAMYRMADSRGQLPIAIHQMRAGDQFFAPPERAAAGEFTEDDVSDRLRGGTVKIFMDPVFPRSAGWKVHADGHREHLGAPYYTQEEADRLALAAASRGLQVAIHCLGTWAIEQGLDALERAIREYPSAAVTHRIEHFSQPTREQIARASALGVIVCHQPPFFYQGGDRAAVTLAELGIDAPPAPMRMLLDEGVAVAASSDFPCAPLEPLKGLFSIVSRRTRDGVEQVAPEEAISATEGLRLYSLGGARAMSRDHEVGTLEAGKRADMVVLSHDPGAVAAEDIREITVQQTYVDGQRLFERLPAVHQARAATGRPPPSAEPRAATAP
ncbi:MAG: amidohydrolase family protein [Dehalococcoidia bacterium]|jgi:hypothetical protein|nr:amidohydrolase family protein [Dehalococcoidia bacterium]